MSGDGKRREILVVPVEANGLRLDRFITESLSGVSRKAVKKALDNGQVFVDGRCQRRAGTLLQTGETVMATLDLPEAPLPPPSLAILYRDQDLLAIDKPAGLPAHPTVAGRANALDLVTALLAEEGRSVPPILLHRLDADTTGVLLFALTAAANRDLYRQFVEHSVEKVYHALVAGTPPDTFSVCNHLKAGVRGRTVAVASGGQPAETSFRTLAISAPGYSPLCERGAGGDFDRRSGKIPLDPPLPKGEDNLPNSCRVALVEARPRTGRTHQIRAHLSGAGWPLLGDRLYGGPTEATLGGTLFPLRRHLLHAAALTLRHPGAGRPFTISAPHPDDFADILRHLH